MLGQMQNWPLLLHKIIDFAASQHGGQEVVSRTVEGPIHRLNYRDLRTRALKVAQRLARDGIKLGDRIGTLAWNTHRHLEVWYGITGVGAIYHTVNPRLFPEQIAWIINHAEDRALFVDLTFLPIVEALQAKLPTIERFIVLTDRAHLPATKLRNAVAYEDWLAEADGDFQLARIRREHRRRALLHLRHDRQSEGRALLAPLERPAFADLLGARCAAALALDLLLAGGAAVPRQFLGPRLLLPDARRENGDARRQARRRLDLRAAGDGKGRLQRRGADGLADAARLSAKGAENAVDAEAGGHRRLRLPAGDDPRLRARLRRRGQARLGHDRDEPDRLRLLHQAGSRREVLRRRAALQVEAGLCAVRRRNEDRRRRQQAAAVGRQDVRPAEGAGPAVAKSYFKGEGGEILDEDGLFDTGDVATIDPDGYMQITDRAKDVIKSGGEWISSIDIENLAVGHPDVAEAAVIGIAHPKWDERPLLVVVAKEGRQPKTAELLEFLAPKIAKWWMPDDMQIVGEIPHTATGKINKLKLREAFSGYKLPTA